MIMFLAWVVNNTSKVRTHRGILWQPLEIDLRHFIEQNNKENNAENNTV